MPNIASHINFKTNALDKMNNQNVNGYNNFNNTLCIVLGIVLCKCNCDSVMKEINEYYLLV